MKYVCGCGIIVNRIRYDDGRLIEDIMGGGGFFAYSGLLFSDPESLFVAGVGKDFDKYYGKWFDDNNVSRDGIKLRVDYCPYDELEYLPDGRWRPHSIYTEEYRARALSECHVYAHDLEPYLTDCKGIYIGAPLDKVYIDTMIKLREKYGFKMMWECVIDPAINEKTKPRIIEIAKSMDIWSLNRPESFLLFDVDSEEAAIEKIKELGVPCYYRVGSKGAYMIMNGEAEFVPVVHLVPAEEEVDPTGCGNSSTAAALWAFCEGFNTKEICAWGNIVAAHNVLQFGPTPIMNDEKRKSALELMKKICAEG